jgi:hypothetical protein
VKKKQWRKETKDAKAFRMRWLNKANQRRVAKTYGENIVKRIVSGLCASVGENEFAAVWDSRALLPQTDWQSVIKERLSSFIEPHIHKVVLWQGKPTGFGRFVTNTVLAIEHYIIECNAQA